MSEIELLTQFRARLLEFISGLSDMYPNDGNILLGKWAIEQNKADIVGIINTVAVHCVAFKDHIKARDESFFLDKDLLNKPEFEFLSNVGNDEIIQRIRSIWTKDMDNEDKEAMWEWMDIFMNLAERYKELCI